jgi:hypothetical protein
VTTMTLSALPVLPTNPGGPDGAPASLGNAMPGAGTPTAGATDPALAGAGPFQAALAMALGSPTPGVPVPGVAPGKVPGSIVPGDLPGAATTPAGDGGPTGPKGPTITGPKGHKGRWGPQAAVAQLPSGAGNAAAPLTGILPVSPLTGPGATPAAVDPATALAAVSRKETTPAPGPGPQRPALGRRPPPRNHRRLLAHRLLPCLPCLPRGSRRLPCQGHRPPRRGGTASCRRLLPRQRPRPLAAPAALPPRSLFPRATTRGHRPPAWSRCTRRAA